MADSKPNNFSIGIDSGTYKLKAAYFDGSITKLISEAQDFNTLREECEIIFDDFVTSCVIAIPDEYNKKQRDEISFKVKSSGFENVSIINSTEAIIPAVNFNGTALIFDLGKVRGYATVINNNSIIERLILNDLSGDYFDKIFSEWLAERFLIDLIDENILKAAEKLKISFSENEFDFFRNKKILREDFIRLIRFQVRKIMRILKRLKDQYKPQKIIFTGSSCKIPFIKETAEIILNSEISFIDSLTAKGAALKANSLTFNESRKEDLNLKLKKLRYDLISIEEFLNRTQKDRIYSFFNKAETGGFEIISILENLISEIKKLSVK